jgi:AGCS family alanine or glycine:cation symporter
VAANPLGGIENAINTVFEPIADALSAFVFAEITVFGITFP